jgi:preprotein translocase subunit SecY
MVFRATKPPEVPAVRSKVKLPGAVKKIALALGGLAFFELGTRIGLPGVNVDALASLLNQVPRGGLLGLYDLIGGGGLGRGAVLALGVVPFISASILMRLARVVSPGVQGLHETSDGRDRLTRWTRGITIALAAIQGYGFSQFLQNTPGVVANPGFGFTAQTMLILTAGSALAMMVTERLVAPSEEEEDPEAPVGRVHLEEGSAPAAPLRTPESVAGDVR